MTVNARLLAALFIATIPALPAVAQPGTARPAGNLTIYIVDVEGGNATLFVAPGGESVLIDSGNGGAAAARDAGRIMAAVRDAGLTKIDHLITTHWHVDHFGGMAELAKQVPVNHFVDHGGNVQPAPSTDEFLRSVYPNLYGKATHTVVKPGDAIPIAGLEWKIVASGGATLQASLPGGAIPNPACSSSAPKAADPSENAQSVGSAVTFGQFRAVHLGDLTWNKERDLMCPSNRLGTVDLMISSHHGLAVSNSPALVHGLRPRVVVMNNGIRKGAEPDAMRVFFTSPGLEDLWQVHASQLSGQEYTVPGLFIANTADTPESAMSVAPLTPAGTPAPPAHNGTAYWIKVSARNDGTFTVTNGRNNFAKTYTRPAPLSRGVR